MTEQGAGVEASRTFERFRATLEPWILRVLDESPMAIGLSRDGVMIGANTTYVRLFGYDSPEELCGRSILDLIAPSGRSDIIEKIRRRSAGLPVPSSYEVTGLRRDGTEFPFMIKVTLAETPAGPFTLAFVTDLGELRTSQRRLSDALGFSDRLIAASPMGILAYHETGACVLANEAASRMVGGTIEQLKAQDFRQISSWKPNGLLEAASRVLATDVPERGEFRLLTTFGRELWGDMSLSAFHSAAGRHLLLTIVDVTERKQTLAALHLSEQRARMVLEGASDAFLFVDDSGHLTMVNDAACALSGRDRAELFGMELGQLLECCEGRSGERGEVSCGPAGTPCEGILRHRRGHDIPVEVTLSSVGEGKDRLTVYSIRDVSARRAMDKLRQEFLSSAAHELRTPLTVISSYAQLLRRWAPEGHEPREAEAFAVLDRQTRRLRRLVSDLLDLSRSEIGSIQLRPRPVELRTLVDGVVSSMKGVSSRHTIVLEALDHPRAIVDAERIEQVLMNLLDNAIRYWPSGGEIRVELRSAGGRARISVHDRGVGIPAELQPRVFERFFRGHAATQGMGGMGVGLHVSRMLIELHGGRLSFESREGEGSSFHVELPLDSKEGAP